MGSISRICYLRNQVTGKKIILPHNKLISVGRGEETEIYDMAVSRTQIECIANAELGQVKVKPVGQATSGIDGYAVEKDMTYIVGLGHKLELYLGKYYFDIVFDLPLNQDDQDVMTSSSEREDETKNNSSRICYLLNQESKKRIILPHNELVKIGRGKETDIYDKCISRNHIECIADTELGIVKVKPVGKAVSGIDGYIVKKDKTYVLGHGHIIELTFSNHYFEIIFEPQPKVDSTEELGLASKK